MFVFNQPHVINDFSTLAISEENNQKRDVDKPTGREDGSRKNKTRRKESRNGKEGTEGK